MDDTLSGFTNPLLTGISWRVQQIVCGEIVADRENGPHKELLEWWMKGVNEF